MKLNNETKIGIMVSVVLVILAILTIKSGNFNFSTDGYQIKVRFNDINGVNLNSPVMFNGYEVGVVEDILIKDLGDETKMELVIWIKEEAKLREGSKAYIKNLGLMGEKYIGLTSGSVQGEHLPPGSIITGEEPPSFEALVQKGHNIAVELDAIAKNINQRLDVNKDNIDDILANMNKTIENLASVTETADERLKKNEDHIDQIITNFSKTSTNVEELTHDLKLNPWKILHKSKEK